MSLIYLFLFTFLCLSQGVGGPATKGFSTNPPPGEWQLRHNNTYLEKQYFSPVLKKLNYFSLQSKDGKLQMQKVKVRFEEIDDECIGEKIIYFRIPGTEDPDVPIIAAPGLEPFTSTDAVIVSGKGFRDISDKVSINFKKSIYELTLQKNKSADSLELYLSGNASKQLLSKTVLDPDYPPRLITAADINKDGKLDLIVQITEKQSICWVLYLSGQVKNERENLKEVARCFYTAIPC